MKVLSDVLGPVIITKVPKWDQDTGLLPPTLHLTTYFPNININVILSSASLSSQAVFEDASPGKLFLAVFISSQSYMSNRF
jgi:hypothetical protein